MCEIKIDKLSGIGKVDYYKCRSCGFVLSKTHAEMESLKWEILNRNYHTYGESPDNIKEHNPPPYLEQAMFLKVLMNNSIISGNILDWGSGYGTLAGIMDKYFNVKIKVYDKYMQRAESKGIDYIQQSGLSHLTFDTVISSAVFEHIRNREDMEEINKCVADNGALVVHTVVCEEVPKDPDWFYLGAVHCAFHTNKSMKLLMDQWGYKSSIYCPLAKSWVLFRENRTNINQLVKKINLEFQFQYLYYKNGFMDYWK